MADWYSSFVSSEEKKAEDGDTGEEATWYSMLVGNEETTTTANASSVTEDDAEEIEFGADDDGGDGGGEDVINGESNEQGYSIDGDIDINQGGEGGEDGNEEGKDTTDDWFSKFEGGEKYDAEEEEVHWLDLPLQWITGRKAKGLSLEIYEHEHHMFELAHEGVVVISEEGIHAAYEHLTHDALLAIAKAHIRFGIVEVHDSEEIELLNQRILLVKSQSGRNLTGTSDDPDNENGDNDELDENGEKKKVKVIQARKKRMTTAEIDAEAEKLVAKWEHPEENGDSSSSSSVIPSWFYGHIERLGFVPASKVVKTNDDENWYETETGTGAAAGNSNGEDEAFEKGHSVALIDDKHDKIPVNTEGTILLIKKDGTIMVNFAGYGVAPLTNKQIVKSKGTILV